MFLLECCPHVSPGLGKNWSQRPSQFTAAQLGYSRTSCCCSGGSLLHVPLSSHFGDMPLLPCKLSGLCFLQGKIRFTFSPSLSPVQPEFLPVAPVTSPQLLKLSHKYATLGAGQTSGACRITGSILHAGEPFQCCITAAFRVGWKS